MDEKKTGQEQTVYDSDIDMWLQQFKEENNIDDLRTMPQNTWSSALRYIQKHLFPDRSIFKSSQLLDNVLMPTNYNTYDFDLLSDVCDYYIYMCLLYNREITIYGFSLLTGIDNKLISQWGSGSAGGKLSRGGFNIWEKIITAREESLSARLYDGRQNPVGALSILNHFYSWNLPGVTREVARPALSADQLPKLGQNNNFCLPGTDKETNRNDNPISGT